MICSLKKAKGGWFPGNFGGGGWDEDVSRREMMAGSVSVSVLMSNFVDLYFRKMKMLGLKMAWPLERTSME